MEGKKYKHPRFGIVKVLKQPGYVKGSPRNVLIRLGSGLEFIVPQRSLRKLKKEKIKTLNDENIEQNF